MVNDSSLHTARTNYFDLNATGSFLYELAINEIGSEVLVSTLSETLRKQVSQQFRALKMKQFNVDQVKDLDTVAMYYLVMAIDMVKMP